MIAGAIFADHVVETQVAPTLYRVTNKQGHSLWLRVGAAPTRARAMAFVNANVDGVGPFSFVEHGEHVGLLCPAALGTEIAATTRARLFGCFQQLATIVHRLHAQNLRLGGLEPEGFRFVEHGVLVLPALDLVAPWVAPEGPTHEPADWFLVGLLLYVSLTQLRRFPWYGQTNGPDPRDRSPRSSEVLSALAMDLLLLDPGERPDGREVLEDLVEPSEGPVEDVVDRVLRSGGLAAVPLSWLDRVDEVLGAVEVEMPSDEVTGLIEEVSALSKHVRTQIAALLKHPEMLSSAHRARAARQLGQALSISGVKLAFWRDPDAVQQSVIVDVLRARPCPAVVVLADAPVQGLVDLCTASGIRVDGDRRSPSDALDVLPFNPVDSVLWDGDMARLDGHLLELGVPRRQGFAGRAVDTVAEWVGPRDAHQTRLDASRPRAAGRLASELAWIRPERAVLVARWSRREALRAGEPEAGAIVHLVDAALTGGVPTGEPMGEHGEDILLFSRALSLRHRGAARAVVSVLDDALPLVSLGDGENGAAGLLVAEALVDSGAWKRARLVLRSLQVDARRTGNRMLDVGCLAQAARMGYDVSAELEHMLALVDCGEGVIAWWVARARALMCIDDPHRALEIVRSCRVFEHWPLRLAGAAAVESRMFRLQLLWAIGEPVAPVTFKHPRAEAWRALADAVNARRSQDADAVVEALLRAEQRFEGAHARLLAAAAQRTRGLWIGGPRGGNLVTQADALFQQQDRHNPALITRMLLRCQY